MDGLKAQIEQAQSESNDKQKREVEELKQQVQELTEQIADKDDIIKLHSDKNTKLTN